MARMMLIESISFQQSCSFLVSKLRSACAIPEPKEARRLDGVKRAPTIKKTHTAYGTEAPRFLLAHTLRGQLHVEQSHISRAENINRLWCARDGGRTPDSHFQHTEVSNIGLLLLLFALTPRLPPHALPPTVALTHARAQHRHKRHEETRHACGAVSQVPCRVRVRCRNGTTSRTTHTRFFPEVDATRQLLGPAAGIKKEALLKAEDWRVVEVVSKPLGVSVFRVLDWDTLIWPLAATGCGTICCPSLLKQPSLHSKCPVASFLQFFGTGLLATTGGRNLIMTLTTRPNRRF